MNAKIVIAIATFVMLFAGVTVADSADAEVTPVTITYDVDGDLFTKTLDSKEVTLETLETLGATTAVPEGKTFVKWNTQADGLGASYVAGSTYIIPAEENSAVLYAQFEATSYTATFLNAEGEVIITKTGTSDAPADLAAFAGTISTARDGFIFVGWLAEGAETPIETADIPALTADVTYTATYVTDFVVTFVDGDKSYVMKVSTIQVPALGEREGFTKLGWFVGDEQVVDPAAYAFTADTVFEAKWEPINCFVTFVAGDFSKTVPVLYGETVGQLALPEGYSAWDFDFATPIKGDVTITAIETAPAEPSGLDDPIVQTCAILGGLLAIILIAVLVSKVKKGEIIIGKGPNAKKGKKDIEEDEE